MWFKYATARRESHFLGGENTFMTVWAHTVFNGFRATNPGTEQPQGYGGYLDVDGLAQAYSLVSPSFWQYEKGMV